MQMQVDLCEVKVILPSLHNEFHDFQDYTIQRLYVKRQKKAVFPLPFLLVLIYFSIYLFIYLFIYLY